MGLWRRLSDAILPNRQPVAGPDADPEAEIEVCLHEHIRPALETVRDQLASEGFDVSLEADDESVELRAMNFNGLPLVYRAHGFVYKEPVVNLASMGKQGSLARFARIEIESGGKTREFPTSRCHREAIEKAALAYYRRFLMHSAEGD